MAYDPMNYVTQPGNAIAQIGGVIGNTIQSLPSILKQNKEYQLLQQKLQSEEKIAESAYTGMNSLLVDMGANKKVRAPNQGEPTDDYLKYIAQEVSSLATDENGGLSPQKLQQLQQRVSQIGLGQDAGVKESIAMQGQINKYDPMSTIQLNKDTVQPESLPVRAQIGEGDIGRTPMTGRSSSFDPITGVGVDVETGAVNTPAPVQKKYDPLEDVEASLLNALKNKEISASKFAEQKMEIATARGKMNYDEGQNSEKITRDTNEANAKAIIDRIGKGNIYKNGVLDETPNPSEIRKNPELYSLDSADYPKEFNPNTGTGSKGKGAQKISDELRALRDKATNDMKTLTDGGAPLEGTEIEYKRAIVEYRVMNAAIKVQDVGGGNAIVPDDVAIQKGREYVEMADSLSMVVQELKNLPNDKNFDSIRNNPKNALQYFGSNLNSLQPEAKNKIIQAINEGYTFEEILAKLQKAL